MMRNIALIALLVAAPASALAQAQETTQANQLAFDGQVGAGCIISAPVAPTASNASATGLGAGTADIVVTQLVDDDSVPVGAQMTLTLESACNQSHTLTIASLNGGLANADAAALTNAPPFRTLLPYAVSVTWAGQSQTFQSGDTVAPLAIGDAARGSVTVTIQVPAGGAPLVAGSYSDQLVLELGVAG